MTTPTLATKLYVPHLCPKASSAPRLIERLSEGLHGKLTLISAPAGFGKTTLVSAWVAACAQPVAWLSLDEGDNDPARFLTYLIAALQTIAANIGAGMLCVLQSPQPPAVESILTALLNEIAALADHFILVLDDYHVVDSKPVDKALNFLLEHLPPQMHLLVATREDPPLPLARLRARGQLAELRAADLRFTPVEAAAFLNQVMGLSLSPENIAALETRTEGWIAGLQLAALSMQGQQDVTGFIQSFTGSHRFVLDYLVEEVLQRQPARVQTFLLRTSILDRLCGPLCDAVMLDSSASGQETLEYLERANLFIVPLDNERRWYRYHHLFGDLLRQRLGQSLTLGEISDYHIRASQWYEDNGMAFEAFRQATAANDVERAERLMEGTGIPRHSRGALKTVVEWLTSLPASVLDARPLLRVRSATMTLMTGQTSGVEEKLQAAEEALQSAPQDAQTRDLIGQIAAARSTLAVTQYRPDIVITQAQRALEYLLPENLTFRFTANWTLSTAYQLQGDRAAAKRTLAAAQSFSRANGSTFSTILATCNLGHLQELENQLHVAAETYRSVLHMAGDQPIVIVNEAYLGLARIHYEWNDLEAAERHGQQCLQLTRQYERGIDRFIFGQVVLARLKLARGEVDSAAALLAQAEQAARQQNFLLRMPEIAAAQVLVLLRQGSLAAAADLARTHELPICQARVLLAQGNASAALAVLAPYRQQMEAKNWQDERLKAMVLQAIALHAHGEKDKAVHLLGEALALAEPGGFIRLFVDEGLPMARLLSEAAARGIAPDYTGRLLAAFPGFSVMPTAQSNVRTAQYRMVEPLSQRELEILPLIAQGLSNREIGERLFLALDTVKGHNRRIYGKLQAQSRTEAVARARSMELL